VPCSNACADGCAVAPDRVYLHIGAPKTGTTYLQALLAANRAALESEGILYPPSVSDAHHAAAWDLRGTPAQRRDVRGIEGSWDTLVGRANAWDGEAVIVSSELFVYCNDRQVRTALSAFDAEVHVVYTARDLIRQVPAVWQERVKNQQTISYPDYLAAVITARSRSGKHAFWRAQDAAAVAKRWSHGLPAEAVHVVTAPPTGSSPYVLWERFVSVLGRRAEVFDAEAAGPVNRSLGLLQTELLRRYNERYGSGLSWPVYRRMIRLELDRSFAAAIPDGRKLTLPAADYEFFAAAARDMVSELRRAGYDVVGDLDELLPPAQATPSDVNQTESVVASDAEVLGAALDVMHTLLARQREGRTQRRAEPSDDLDTGSEAD
jgi:hypothetical protein